MQFESRTFHPYSFLVLVLFHHASNVKTLFFVFAIIHSINNTRWDTATIVRTESDEEHRMDSDGLHYYHYVTSDSAKKCYNKIFFINQIGRDPKRTKKVLLSNPLSIYDIQT